MRFNKPLLWLIVATTGLLGMLSQSEGMSAQSDDSVQTGEPRVIEVVAKRYEFVPSSIDVAQGEPVRIVVSSGDGFHGFGIEAFDISKEIARGETVTIEFTPDVAGEFPILCTGYCGEGHEDMKGVLVVRAQGAEQP
jgi:cytochrome c oxidase subunit 2